MLESVNPFNQDKTYTVEFSQGEFIIKQYVCGQLSSEVKTDSIYATSEYSYIDQEDLELLTKDIEKETILNWYNKGEFSVILGVYGAITDRILGKELEDFQKL